MGLKDMKKGRASGMTRPEPTINGNCDSWAFIVGKKGAVLGLVTGKPCKLRAHNEILSTIYQQQQPNNFKITQHTITQRSSTGTRKIKPLLARFHILE
jgi:hypothetical protein